MKIPVCSHCGADEVRADAYAEWDVSAQQWAIAQTFDKGAYCGPCDGETSLEWRDAPPVQATLFPLKEDDRPVTERSVASPL
jgi:hypothetical protein